jgi:4-amino-4-deoxychorismate lyase
LSAEPLGTWVDGRAGAPVPALADGALETLAVVDGRIRLLDRHLARLALAAARLGLTLPAAETIAAELAEAAARPGVAVLRLACGRLPGEGGTRRVLTATGPRLRPGAWWTEGIVARTCRTPAPADPAFAGLKRLDRAAFVAARGEWDDPAIAEGLLFDVHGRVVCGTMTNVFAVVDGRLATPDVTRAGVAGVMRGALLEAWRAEGRPVEVRDLAAAELARAEEVFVTNALIGAWPVRRLDGRELAPGPWARAAQVAVAAWPRGGLR